VTNPFSVPCGICLQLGADKLLLIIIQSSLVVQAIVIVSLAVKLTAEALLNSRLIWSGNKV
jgi:hypothetical protein